MLRCLEEKKRERERETTSASMDSRPFPSFAALPRPSLPEIKAAQDSPDLRVSHQTIGESDGETVSLERTVVVLSGNGIHVGGVGVFDSVSLDALGGSDTPTVVDAEEEAKATVESKGELAVKFEEGRSWKETVGEGRERTNMRQTLSVEKQATERSANEAR